MSVQVSDAFVGASNPTTFTNDNKVMRIQMVIFLLSLKFISSLYSTNERLVCCWLNKYIKYTKWSQYSALRFIYKGGGSRQSTKDVGSCD
jgi:hypothetical protein